MGESASAGAAAAGGDHAESVAEGSDPCDGTGDGDCCVIDSLGREFLCSSTMMRTWSTTCFHHGWCSLESMSFLMNPAAPLCPPLFAAKRASLRQRAHTRLQPGCARALIIHLALVFARALDRGAAAPL